VSVARVTPMPEDRLAAWRAGSSGAGTPLPTDGELEAVELTVDDVVVGGALLGHTSEAGRGRTAVRRLQTTLDPSASEPWAAVLRALEEHARGRGAATIVTAVPPALSGVFRAAGYLATMTTVSKRLDPGSAPELQEDRRVAVRPMTTDERRRFADEVAALLRDGMTRAGVLSGTSLGDLGDRLAGLAADPAPEGELLVVGLVDGVPVGRAWATLVTADDGALDFLGNTLELFPEYRGQRLTPSFLGALRRHVQTLGVRDVHLRVYAHDDGARRTFLEAGAGIDDVHLRKDLV
jgi:GNAT superfamily N-acetyltransferase